MQTESRVELAYTLPGCSRFLRGRTAIGVDAVPEISIQTSGFVGMRLSAKWAARNVGVVVSRSGLWKASKRLITIDYYERKERRQDLDLLCLRIQVRGPRAPEEVSGVQGGRRLL